ncbi:MAG: TetR family transcriptional regulator [Archangium sp.]
MKKRFTRARQPEQKEERRAHLLATARAMLQEGVELRTFSLNELGRRAKMAKANIYRYFESREAVLLALLGDESSEWIDALTRLWPADRPQVSLDAFVKGLVHTMTKRPLMCELLSILPSVLEQNLSEESVLTFKRFSFEVLSQVSTMLAQRCPALTARGHAELLNAAATAMVGLYPTTHPPPAVAKVTAEGDLRFFRREFSVELERFLRALAADEAKRRSDD